jgi:hypothetical protein
MAGGEKRICIVSNILYFTGVCVNNIMNFKPGISVGSKYGIGGSVYFNC